MKDDGTEKADENISENGQGAHRQVCEASRVHGFVKLGHRKT